MNILEAAAVVCLKLLCPARYYILLDILKRV